VRKKNWFGCILLFLVDKGRRINNLLVFDLTLLFSPDLQILCIASVTEMIFKFGEGKIRWSKGVSYLYGVPKVLIQGNRKVAVTDSSRIERGYCLWWYNPNVRQAL
jgi:hypothetical protein